MRFVSTRGGDSGQTYSFEEAVLAGWADDSGLILPQSLPTIAEKLPAWSKLSFSEVCVALFREFILPRLTKAVAAIHEEGALCIKHSVDSTKSQNFLFPRARSEHEKA